MFKRSIIKLPVAFLLLVFFGGVGILGVSAQTNGTDVQEYRAQLEANLVVIEKEIEIQQDILTKKQKEGVSLERDIAILDAQIQKAKLSIRARTIAIQNLDADIGVKKSTINKYSVKIDRERESLAGLLRRTHELDSYSIVEVALSDKKVSDFFGDLDAFQYIEDSITESLGEIGAAKKTTEEEKVALEDKKSEESDLRRIQELEKKRIETNEAEKKRILKETRGQEKVYQQTLKEKQQNAAAIRTALFTLQGSAAIPFEKALALAKLAGEKTGVRPAVILGVIAEESNLGQNVGKGTWSVDMHPTRDVPVFKEILARLGLDPDKMPVSKKVWYGYGGAMGPAQFIPSTWILYEEKIANLTGHRPPNPWDPGDAFMACAILMKENGANEKTPAAERLAALRYLAGWKNATKKSYAFYGDDVMTLAAKYQKQIDILGGN
ncbi:MAG: Peptidase M23 [Parcubacteria group bacterium GW2011_GWA1_47_8]|nr:MAG: Peptidase M23 [Parcubacteria group bacterium GW2011_GWA1_47_8]KKW07934.1 MAG: Peptidase M23 [Parcubacteria group bacterium GW2011_GWA2_49_16]